MLALRMLRCDVVSPPTTTNTFPLRYSRHHYETALSASTDNPKTLFKLGDVLKELAILEKASLKTR